MGENRALRYLLWDQHEGRRFRNKDEFLKWCSDNSVNENEAIEAWRTLIMIKSAYPEFEMVVALWDNEGY